MSRTAHPCRGCQGRTTARHRLCPACCHEVHYGLHGGRWVLRGGVRIWQPDPTIAPPDAPMTPGRERLLKIAHTRYTWHGLRDDTTVRLENEYQQWRRAERARKAAA